VTKSAFGIESMATRIRGFTFSREIKEENGHSHSYRLSEFPFQKAKVPVAIDNDNSDLLSLKKLIQTNQKVTAFYLVESVLTDELKA
jgi:hypothetical protein